MDAIQNLNKALAYIEAHLEGEIDFRKAAAIACCSEHQFNRMFSFLSGVGLSEYIRSRRLALAALELQKGGVKVIDIALKYGYQSPEAFSRAFQQMHGIAPSLAKKSGSGLKAYPPMTFQLTIKGGAEMNFHFAEKEAFTVVGLRETVDTIGGNFQPEIWNELDKEDFLEKLKKLADTGFAGMLHVNANVTADSRDYYLGVATTKEIPLEFTAYTVPAATWVVFKTSGPQPETMLETWERIYAEWMPSSGYELAEPIEFVRDLNLSSSSSENEIWIPVKKSK